MTAITPIARPAPAPQGRPAQRLGNGRIEVQLYPGVTDRDRIAAAMALLDDTGWCVAQEAARDG